MSYRPIEDDELNDELDALTAAPEANPVAYVQPSWTEPPQLISSLPLFSCHISSLANQRMFLDDIAQKSTLAICPNAT
jgi:hypothetical protein